MTDTDKYEGVRTPFGIISTEDILEILEPIRKRDNKIAELNAEVKRLREENALLVSQFRIDTDKCGICGKEIKVPEGEVWSDGCWECYFDLGVIGGGEE